MVPMYNTGRLKVRSDIIMLEIYYVEDDVVIAQDVKEYLEQHNCKVMVFHTIADAKQMLLKKVPNAILVDWNLPDGEGDVLCQWIRSKWENLPIIFLTVRGEVNDVVAGFRNGADDYVVKPFELEILYQRILALQRRLREEKKTVLSCDFISMDLDKAAVYYGQDEVTLSKAEYELLLLLMRNKGKIITRRQLLEQVWDNHGNFVNDNTLTVTIKRLREKLHNPACLKTVRSFGYRIEDSI